jgi:hypothetical protein
MRNLNIFLYEWKHFVRSPFKIVALFLFILAVLTPIKQEYYSKFRLLIMRLIYSLKLGVYPGSIFG